MQIALAMVLASHVGLAVEGSDTLGMSSDTLAATGQTIEDRLRDLLDHLSTEMQSLESATELAWLRQHPYDLNTVTAGELAGLPGMTFAEARAVIEFRARLGKFTSVGQLSLMEGQGETILEKLSPFLRVAKGERRRVKDDQLLHLRTRFVRSASGGSAGIGMAGSPVRLHSSLTASPLAGMQLGCLFEKDPGERMADGFVSASVALNRLLWGASLIIGDYVVESGQGLVFWHAGSAPKGVIGTDAPRRSALGIRPYHSSNENSFLRGIAVGSEWPARFGLLRASVMMSQRSLSANLDENGNVSGFYDEGFYRTDAERKKKNLVRERLYGGKLEIEGETGWKAGFAFSRIQLDRPVLGRGPFTFAGSEQGSTALDVSFHSARITVYGEVASSNASPPSAVVGTALQADPWTHFSLSFRTYPPGSAGRYSWAFGEHSGGGNERGAYLGWTARLGPRVTFSGFLDCFDFPWRTATNPLPSSGMELLAQADFQAAKWVSISGRYSMRQTEHPVPALDASGREVRLLMERFQSRYRLTGTARIGRRVGIKGRVEVADISSPVPGTHERGVLLFHELRYSPFLSLEMETRMTFFDTRSYDSRIYESEGDLDGVFCNAMMFGKGKRWYVLLRWKPLAFFAFSMKYAASRREPFAGETPPEEQFSLQAEVKM